MDGTMNPSTYRQVVENMTQILELMKGMGDLSKLPMSVEEMAKKITEMSKTIDELDKKIINPPSGSNSGTVSTDEGIKVIGTHTNTKDSDKDTSPSSYSQGMTLELKKVTAIGLSGKTGMSEPYCFVLTLKQDGKIPGEGETTLDYKPMQIAFATSAMAFYFRVASSALNEASWGNWMEQPVVEVRQQIIDQKEQPTDQKIGEYWSEEIE